MITALGFIVAAVGGTLARAEAGRRWNGAHGLARGTLAVNVAGAFAIGVLHGWAAPEHTVVVVGGLGAFTTFSSFAADTAALVERHRVGLAVAYVAGTVGLAVVACAAGVALAPSP